MKQGGVFSDTCFSNEKYSRSFSDGFSPSSVFIESACVYLPVVITGYERITYPNCQGNLVAFGAEDGTFRAPEYTISSAPANNEAPYDIDIVADLPQVLGSLSVASVAGSTSGTTKITVSPLKGADNSYMYKTGATVDLPNYGDDLSATYTAWDGTSDITATDGNKIVIAEVDASNKAVKGGITTVVSAT